jgi:hypothetical protein
MKGQALRCGGSLVGINLVSLEFFETARQELREARRDAADDIVLEVMDFIAGWCSPHRRLGPGNAS